jgi:hypothetical protein
MGGSAPVVVVPVFFLVWLVFMIIYWSNRSKNKTSSNSSPKASVIEPSCPQDLTASCTAEGIQLRWRSPRIGGDSVTAYNVFLTPDSGPMSRVGRVQGRSFLIRKEGLLDGINYTIKIIGTAGGYMTEPARCRITWRRPTSQETAPQFTSTIGSRGLSPTPGHMRKGLRTEVGLPDGRLAKETAALPNITPCFECGFDTQNNAYCPGCGVSQKENTRGQ